MIPLMENAVCADCRAHGMFKFYGANRTGRYSGKIIQLQNLPQNHIPDLAQARELVKCGDYDALTVFDDKFEVELKSGLSVDIKRSK